MNRGMAMTPIRKFLKSKVHQLISTQVERGYPKTMIDPIAVGVEVRIAGKAAIVEEVAMSHLETTKITCAKDTRTTTARADGTRLVTAWMTDAKMTTAARVLVYENKGQLIRRMEIKIGIGGGMVVNGHPTGPQTAIEDAEETIEEMIGGAVAAIKRGAIG